VNLSAVFTNVAYKQLVAVDLPHLGSNQHELNGVAKLREFFGTSASVQDTFQWHYFRDDAAPTSAIGKFTFYDARLKSTERTARSEWRMYYYGDFLRRASVGDWWFLARTHTGKLFALVFQHGSAWLRAAQVLFGVEESKSSFKAIKRESLDNQQLQLLRIQILTELGLEVPIPVRPRDEDLVIERFGRNFPKTKEMSAFARAQVDVDAKCSDEALVLWLEREEELFRAMERLIIGDRLKSGFTEVDDFIDFSLSAHQRRKSRMGHALQNHLQEIFDRNCIRYTPQARTEGKRKPDFIFPGESEYHDLQFNASLLVMLGAKATCKDRWRQVLVEASRIPDKHLCTLEPGISIEQTKEMQEECITLVVPASLHSTYTREQLTNILSISEFVELVRHKQNN
jgi:hypothetical protein